MDNTTVTPRAFVLKPTVQLPARSGRLVLTLRNKQAAAVAPNVRVLRIVNGSLHITDLFITQKEKDA